jgi:chemotaxis protein MotB
MARGRTRRSNDYGQFWPAFVDVLSTLLLVVTLLMSIFMIAQYFAAQEVSGKDSALKRLTRQISELTSMLSLEKGKSQTSQDELASLQASLASLKAENEKLTGTGAKAAEGQVAALSSDLESQKNISKEALSKVDLLNQQLLALRRQIAALSDALDVSQKKTIDSDKTIKDLGARLNTALAQQVQELKRYRSDFFGRLRALLKDRKDIRVVGDRFVFESEVLFPSGSATLTPEGTAAMDQIADAILELQKEIPSDIDWALQINGHTDARPISNPQFPSNWELSTARASSVVKYLVTRGVPPERLVAAGYGEFQPIDAGGSEDAFQKNRRIELKLTNR